jgi:DNA-binding LytR/AlgR family response regulator
MANLKIGIVEDDLLIAESIAMTLQQIGYRTTSPARSYADAIIMIETQSPDLLLVDIMLEGELDGIDLAEKVNSQFALPFVFLTANSDAPTVNRAKAVNPSAYLVKPFNESDLFTSIEIAFSNYNQSLKTYPKENISTSTKGAIFVKEGSVFHKVNTDDIVYVESDNVYLNLHTSAKHYMVRSKLDDFIQDYSSGQFFRVHRSYAININHLESIGAHTVVLAGKEIPLQKAQRDELLQRINTIK